MNNTNSKLKWKPLFLLLVITATSFSCGNQNNRSAEGDKSDGAVEANHYKTLLIIGDDRSGSTSDIRKLTAEEYQMLFESVAKNGGGAVAVCLIGNPLPQSREPFILPLASLENPIPYNPKDTRLTLSQKKVIRKKNAAIAENNQQKLNQNKTAIGDFLAKEINPKVVEYRPSGKDYTDINDALRRINILCNEPQYRDYDKIVVALLSDGKNQPRDNRVEPIVEQLNNTRIQLLLVGWNQPTECFKDIKPEILSSKNGIFEIINNQN
jgi:hypothetical protein